MAERIGCEPRPGDFHLRRHRGLNQAVFGLAGDEPGRIVVRASSIPAVREPLLRLERRGFEVAWAPVDRRRGYRRRPSSPPSCIPATGWPP